MKDFRERLYEKYVSTFKGESFHASGWNQRNFFPWCDHKYLPLLSGLDPKDAILELGCGSGEFLSFLSNRGYLSAEGVDVSAEQVERAISKGLKATVSDALNYLTTRPAHYQAIVGIDFVEHFTKEELLKLIEAIHQALAPGGRLILQTPNGQGLFAQQVIYGDLTHMTIMSPSSLSQLLRVFGFEQIQFHETGPVPRNLKGRLRILLWSLIKTGLNLLRLIETGKRQDIWTESMICCCTKKNSPSISSISMDTEHDLETNPNRSER